MEINEKGKNPENKINKQARKGQKQGKNPFSLFLGLQALNQGYFFHIVSMSTPFFGISLQFPSPFFKIDLEPTMKN